MKEESLRLLLEAVSRGELPLDEAIASLRNLPFENIGFAQIDQHRQLRQGLPEIIFCPGKTAEQIAEIALKLKAHHTLVLATRATQEQANAVMSRVTAGSLTAADARYFPESSVLVFGEFPPLRQDIGRVAIVTAGTADLPVAREAEMILRTCAIPSQLIADIGVAGLHRVIGFLPQLQEAKVCIVIAGMDGVLSSVVGGLLRCPVIACPTSVGYGAAFNGLAPLLTMLNSCAAGVTVVNIDSGFGAAIAAYRILCS